MGLAPTDIGLNYSDDEVFAALLSDYVTVRFRYERLGPDLATIDYLDTVESCTVTYNYLADIKLTASFSITEDPDVDIDYFKQLIRPYVGILMPDGLWTHIPLGTFLLSSPGRESTPEAVKRTVAAYDRELVLRQNFSDGRYKVAAGAIITDEVVAVLQKLDLDSDIKSSPTTMAAARSWDPGTSWAVVVNDLLAACGYGSLFFTPLGVATADLYVEPANRGVDFTYKTDEFSITSGEATETLDIFEVPNNWIFVVSQPDRPVLVSTYTNVNPDSPTSTISRGGRTVTSFNTESDAATQTVLDSLVKKKAAEDSQVYDEVAITTRINPLHGESNTISLTHDPLGIADQKYNETGWEIQCEDGALMKHTVRRAVTI